jgi:hypothetical protein
LSESKKSRRRAGRSRWAPLCTRLQGDVLIACSRGELIMAVRLDRIPAMALRPGRPRAWLWVGLLVLFLLIGMALAETLLAPALSDQPLTFWSMALGAPLACWCVTGFWRMALYIGQHRLADGWDQARQDDVVRNTRAGRRSQQVLGVSLYTALRAPGETPASQLEKVLEGTSALAVQPTREGATALRHSYLPAAAQEPELLLLQVLQQVLDDLRQTLLRVPDQAPLALLLQVDSGLPESLLRRVWRHAWQTSGIRQSTVPVEGLGLDALDQWLDQRIDDQAMLLVVAVQFAPENPEGSAEAAVAVLLGNRLTQNTLVPIAYLHRPEQERESNPDPLLYAARQALDWVPLPSTAIERVWRAGVDGARSADLAQVATQLEWSSKDPQGVGNLDELLGHAGSASPWLAIAAATQTIERGAGAQFIFSIGDDTAALWGTVLTPAPPLPRQE